MELSKILHRNKKGSGTLDMATKVFGAILVLGVIGFVFVIIFGNLADTSDDALPTLPSQTILNETIDSVDELGEALSVINNYNVACTILVIQNETGNATDGGPIISSANYTASGTGGCHVAYSAPGVNAIINNSDWNVTYSWTYKDSAAQDITQNLTAGASSFFSNASTWLTLLSVVIIIAIVALVIAKVKGKGARMGGSEGSGSSGDGLL